MRGFETCWGFSQVAGAIDGSHIPTNRPEKSPSDCFNRKGYYSIIIQGLVDFQGRFMAVCIGWPGNGLDARVFVNSTVYSKGMSGLLFPSWTRQLGSVEVRFVILGDPAYPLLSWLIKPYAENDHSTAEEKLFNYRQSRAPMVVENAFGRLKGRWRCLLKRLDVNLKNVPAVVASYVVLHNFVKCSVTIFEMNGKVLTLCRKFPFHSIVVLELQGLHKLLPFGMPLKSTYTNRDYDRVVG